MEFLLDNFNPAFLAKKIAVNAKFRRLELNLTQEELALKSGVSLGSIKRFETKSEISLKHLLLVALVLNSTENFSQLFTQTQFLSIDELTKQAETKIRKRAHTHDKKS
jgi:transcriptional regulator with XRE-family HTH domain